MAAIKTSMPKSARVYFYTGSFTHTFYKEIFRYPPEGFMFIPSSPDLESQEMKKDIAQSSRWYSPYKKNAERLTLSALAASRIPKVRLIRHPECDLIHSAQYPLLNRHPWVIDFEDVSAFTWYRRDVLNSPMAKRVLENIFSSPSCRAILPWTEAARKSIENGLDCTRFRHKIKVVYPVMTPQPQIDTIMKEKSIAKKIKILFVGTAFFAKGGVEALTVIDELSKSYPLEFVMISNVPDEYRAMYKSNPAITFLSRISNEELKYHYQTSHLFLAPYHTDTFGFVILEAFSYAIPCVGTDQFAIPEIINDGNTGRVIKNSISRFDKNFQVAWPPSIVNNERMLHILRHPTKQYLERLKNTLVSLLENPPERERMAAAAYQEIQSGRFAPTTRMDAMQQVYGKALQATS